MFPVRGDLIFVRDSEWYGLPSGGTLRVSEPLFHGDTHLRVLPRSNASTYVDRHWSTSGGPFHSIHLDECDGLVRIGSVVDRFWKFNGTPGPGKGIDVFLEVGVWWLPRLVCNHYREMLRFGYKEEIASVPVSPPTSFRFENSAIVPVWPLVKIEEKTHDWTCA